MYYFCGNDNDDTKHTITTYKPNVPSGITVIEINEDQYNRLQNGTLLYNYKEKKFIASPESADAKMKKAVEDAGNNLQFLTSTDWKVMRHIREKAIGIQTSLTEDEYIALEKERQNVAAKIDNNILNMVRGNR